MNRPVIIAGQEVSLTWDLQTARRFEFRMGEIGGEPTAKQFLNPRTAATAIFKALWALLPPGLLASYPDPETLYAAVDHEAEAVGIFQAIGGIYQERFPDTEKKSTSRKSPSRASNSESRKTNGKQHTRPKRKRT